jgi:hypothetical protein
MTRGLLARGALAAVTAVSLAFGTVQAFASPAAADTRESFCVWEQCRAECGPGCGGECVNNQCWCDC